MDRNTKKSRGTAFISFKGKEGLDIVLALDGEEF